MQVDRETPEPSLADWRAAMLRAPAHRHVAVDDMCTTRCWGLTDDEILALRDGVSLPVAELACLEPADANPAGPAFVLAYADGAFSDLLYLRPPASLQPWLDGAFAAWLGADGKLRLLDPRPLACWLPQWCGGDPGPVLELRSNTAQKLLHKQAYSGRCHVCDYGRPQHSCDEPGCRSEFAEIRAGRLLWYMAGDGLGVSRAWLLPRLCLVERKDGDHLLPA
jgi:hypothetical protein